MRVGIGYDAHPLVSGRKLILGGIEVPFSMGLSGYSDADVLTHAVADALLGAAGLEDIGRQFPPGEPKYKDISSLSLLTEVRKLLKEAGFKIKNIDATIIAEEPKLSPFFDEMRQRLSQNLEISPEQISVKAKTTNSLGFVGRKEGIAALAVVMIEESLMESSKEDECSDC